MPRPSGRDGAPPAVLPPGADVRSAGLDDVACGLGVSHAGRGGGVADELAAWWPHGHVLVAAAAWIVGDEGDLVDVDGEQVELSWLGIPAEAGCHRVCVAALHRGIVFGEGGAPDL